MQQTKAVQSWMATNWRSVCDELAKISNPTLVIIGSDDVMVPTANSLIIAGKILGAWLVQIKDAGMHYSCNIQIKSIKYYKHFFRPQQTLVDENIIWGC